jgi:hypothetical protein
MGRGGLPILYYRALVGGLEEFIMGQRFTISAAVFVVLAAVPSMGSAATIAQILGSASKYDGQHVDVRGTVERLEQNV